MSKHLLCFVTPTLKMQGNGNWQTALRWSRWLAEAHRVRVVEQWDGEPADLMIALHARKSAASIAAWAERWPERPLVVILTGTDLYRDLHAQPETLRSLELAHRLVVLHELAAQDLPATVRDKCVVCVQSSTLRRPLAKSGRQLRALMVGHLRHEKAPETYFAAARRLAGRDDILLDHIGAATEPGYAEQAQALQAELPQYRWLGERPHGETRDRIQRAHLLVQPSRVEGGAHAVMEAVCAGTPVLASRIPGNTGMLGVDYDGYFPLDDDAALAAWLVRCHDEPAALERLKAQCEARAALFDPVRERATVLNLVHDLLEP